MSRVNSKYKVISIGLMDNGNKKVTLFPVYTTDPQFTTGNTLSGNSERSLEIVATSDNTYFVVGSLYYMDFTLVS